MLRPFTLRKAGLLLTLALVITAAATARFAHNPRLKPALDEVLPEAAPRAKVEDHLRIPRAGDGRNNQAGPAVSSARANSLSQTTPPCGLLGGTTIDAMDSTSAWRVLMGNGAISGSLTTVSGCRGLAVQLNYDLGATQGAWAQLRRDFSPPLDLSAGDHLRFLYRGAARNTIEIGLVSTDDQIYFANSWNEAAGMPVCGYATWDLKDFRKGNQLFPNLGQVKAVFISVAKSTAQSAGGAGSFIVDELQLVNLASRQTPSSSDAVRANADAVKRAADWIAARQQAGGLLKSWQEEADDLSYVYDQSLALIALSATHPARADQLAAKVISLQNGDGSWFEGYHFLNDAAREAKKDIGPIAWMIYALTRYSLKSGNLAAAQSARRGAAWLAAQQRADGSVSNIAEWNLDAWWAFQTAGYQIEADRLRAFLLTQLWDHQVGRFKSDVNTRHIFLDNQTWGAPFLRAIGREQDARRALSYARWTLAVASQSSQFGETCGFDGAGPFGVWNEGTLQYIAQRGENSQFYLDQIARQQATDGGIPGSPLDREFRAYIVWLTPWHGIAPTAWFYFAATGEPFPAPIAGVSAASFSSTAVAPESIVAAFGVGLATQTLAASTLPLPTVLAGTTVKIRDSAGVERLAPLFFVSRDQVNYLVPAGAADGPGVVTVTSGDGKLSLGPLQVAAVAPGLFTANANGQGVAAAVALRVRGDGTQSNEPVAQFDSASGRFVAVPIDLGPATDQVFVVLFGTGIRRVSSQSAATANIGGVNAEVLFAGAQGFFAGVDQVNARIPRSLIGRGEVEVVLMVDRKEANRVRISVK